MIQVLFAPTKPAEPELEDLSLIPDQPHQWNWVESTCRCCGKWDPEDSDLPDGGKPDCLRYAALKRNNSKTYHYGIAKQKYDHQMEYYNALLVENHRRKQEQEHQGE